MQILEEIDSLKDTIDSLRPFSAEQEARILQKFRLDWNYHSNAIEGNSLTYGETLAFLMEGLTAKGKPFKDHLDLKGHNEGINFLFSLVKNKQELNEKRIRELHELILVEPYYSHAQTPTGQDVQKLISIGAYKTQPNNVRTPTGEMHYYASPEETPAKMHDLIKWLHNEQVVNDLHPVQIAAVFHHRFVAIHPFDDGNGSMARLLMNLLLMQSGFPPVIIRKNDRTEYINALRNADAGDLSLFMIYIAQNLIRSLNLQLRGARGESIEEDDDIDKEIALLKASMQSVKDSQIRNDITTKTLLREVFLPLFKESITKCNDLDDLFFRIETRYLVSNTEGVGREFISIRSSTENSKNYVEDSEFYKFDEIGKFTFIYYWVNFKKKIPTFSIYCSIEIEFNQFNYLVVFSNPIHGFSFNFEYDQTPDAEQRKLIRTCFAKAALEEIKARTVV